ncbi:LysR family transcriptional regulator [Jiangella alba]|uniref:DNA-binding transcriptional regulator, LysR family n=1 Tax=Jiangella alba TaxID=561176 RepID=A0A1H5L727_9ACTN|nr:LysR family transcriptional regulator [Jiangella alba]SEE72909.1 DNA-binding transcriptional regulator, LysR family [Jiangella alba]
MTTPPDVESLALLVAIDETGSLGAAGRRFAMSQPAVSKRLRTMERRLGVRLVDRSTRGSTLTEAGNLVAGWAARVLDDFGTLLAGVEALRRDQAATLTVAASMTIAEHLLPGWILEVRRRTPGLHVGLKVANSTEVAELVRIRAAQVGFIESPDPMPRLRSRVVAHDRLVLVVAPGHSWATRRQPVRAHDLARVSLISREPGSGTREAGERAITAHGLTPRSPALELGSSTAVRNSVRTGAGPALLSEHVVAGDLATGMLVEVPTAGLELTRDLRAIWRHDTVPEGPATLLGNIATEFGERTGVRGT